MILNKSSEFVDSALKCMELFPLIIRRIPRFKALILVKTRCMVSLKFFTIFAAMEFHFPSGPKSLVPYHFISFPGAISVQWPCGNLCVYNFYFLWIRSASFFNVSCCPNNIVERWHEDDPVREQFRFNVLAFHVFLDLLKNLQCCEFLGKYSTRI